jgi:hypothetical protein
MVPHEDVGVHARAPADGPTPAHSSYVYVDTAFGGADHRNNVRRVDQVRLNGQPDCYASYQRAAEDLLAWVRTHTNKNGKPTVARFDGATWAPYLPLDFDWKADPAVALGWLRDVIRKLEGWSADLGAVRLYFSGGKGFHAEVPHTLFGGFEPSADLHARLKRAARLIMGDIPFDGSIYDKLRLWRLEGSRHGGSGLYKVRLTAGEVMTLSLDQIRALAARPRPVESVPELAPIPDEDWLPVPELVELWEEAGQAASPGALGPDDVLRVEEILDGVDEGSRDETLWRLACKLRGQNIPMAYAEVVVRDMARKCRPPFDEQAAAEKVRRAYATYKPAETLGAGGMDERQDGHAPETAGGAGESAEKVSAGLKNVVPAETFLRFKTAREIAAETPDEIDWIAEPWVAKGAITEVDGKIKAAGKTTFKTHLSRKILDGDPFMGKPTRKTGVVFLTEQAPRSFREALGRAGLTGRDDFVVLFWHSALGAPWPDVVRAAAAEAKRRGYELLIVDTLGQFAGIVGDGENNAGAALEAMRPLQEVVATDELAVIISRHERKSGGEVGESGRGSSAFSGAVDIVLSLRRPEGQTRDTVRVIHALSRFDETPSELVIELVNGEYRVLGTQQAVKTQEARGRILEALPPREGDAIPLKEIVETAKAPRSTAVQVLDEGVASGTIAKGGSGKRGDPFVYWRPPELVSAGTTAAPAETNGAYPTPADEAQALLSAGTTPLRPAESNGEAVPAWLADADWATRARWEEERPADLAYEDDPLPWDGPGEDS